jgi:hypothetical protein
VVVANTHCQLGVANRASRRRTSVPGVKTARRHTKHSTHRLHRKLGLIRVHEFVDPLDALSPLPANQAVAFARMSRSSFSCRFSRRSRASSSRSALVSTSLPRSGLPLSAAAWANQVEMLCALQPNSRASSAGLRPAFHQFDHLLSELRRIRRLGSWHRGLLSR